MKHGLSRLSDGSSDHCSVSCHKNGHCFTRAASIVTGHCYTFWYVCGLSKRLLNYGEISMLVYPTKDDVVVCALHKKVNWRWALGRVLRKKGENAWGKTGGREGQSFYWRSLGEASDQYKVKSLVSSSFHHIGRKTPVVGGWNTWDCHIRFVIGIIRCSAFVTYLGPGRNCCRLDQISLFSFCLVVCWEANG